MTLHHADSNIDIIWTRNLHIDSGVRQWSYRLMMPLHCLWAKSNNRARVQFQFYVIWFCFFFWLRSFTCTVQLLLHRFLERMGGSFKIGHPRSRGWGNFGRRWTGEWEVLKIRQFSWTSYVYCPWRISSVNVTKSAGICKFGHIYWRSP